MTTPSSPSTPAWVALEARLALVRKLVYEFYELYDPKVIKERKDLQLQIALYRQECVRIHNEFIALLVAKPPKPAQLTPVAGAPARPGATT